MPEFRKISCGCCTHGCACWMHKPDRRAPVVCDEHWDEQAERNSKTVVFGTPLARHPDAAEAIAVAP
jgi:hypothetical protein